MILTQAITDAGAISADWVLVGAFFIIGALLILIARIVANQIISDLKAINKKVDEHEDRIDEIEKTNAAHNNALQNLINNDQLLEKIYAKVKAL